MQKSVLQLQTEYHLSICDHHILHYKSSLEKPVAPSLITVPDMGERWGFIILPMATPHLNIQQNAFYHRRAYDARNALHKKTRKLCQIAS